jgi:hypothetical protein
MACAPASIYAFAAVPTLYHYTDALASQSIAIAREIRPGPFSGKTWLTPDIYGYGALAAAHLSIVGKALSCVFAVHRDEYLDFEVVRPIRDADGRILRPGGGAEMTMDVSIPIDIGRLSALHKP